MSKIHLPLIISTRASDSEAASWQPTTPKTPCSQFSASFTPPAANHRPNFIHVKFLSINFLALSVSTFGQFAQCNRLCLGLLYGPPCLTSPRFQPPFSFPVDHHSRIFLTAHNFSSTSGPSPQIIFISTDYSYIQMLKLAQTNHAPFTPSRTKIQEITNMTGYPLSSTVMPGIYMMSAYQYL